MTSSPETVASDNGVTTEVPEHVKAEHVEISQGGAGSIEADTVSLQQGGAGRVKARDMSVSMGGVGLASTDSLRLEAGASALSVVAQQASVQEGASVFMLLARNVTGDVRPVLDWRAAAAFGVAAGATLSLLRRRR
jgi:hypothetical protein